MLIKEYRICLPLTVEEYRIAQLYMIQKKSREESSGAGSGVEILRNEPYIDNSGGNGQYTQKVYHIGSHLPGWFRAILPKSALIVEEEAWNAYPHTKTIYRCPFIEKFVLEIETVYHDDGGVQDNVFNLSSSEMHDRTVDFLDIVKDQISASDYHREEDPRLFVSQKTGRGPLTENWREEYIQATSGSSFPAANKSIMCAYKLCKVEFRYWGMQSKIERFIHDVGLRKTMLRAHRQAWCWQDEYYGLTMEDIRRLEHETQLALKEKMRHVEDASNHVENGISESQAGDQTGKTVPPELSNASSNVASCEVTTTDMAAIAHRVSSAASVSSGESHRRHSYMSCKSRSFRNLSDYQIGSIEKLQNSSSDEEEFFDAHDDEGIQFTVDGQQQKDRMFRSSSIELLVNLDESLDSDAGSGHLPSHLLGEEEPFSTPLDRRLHQYQLQCHSVDESLPCTPLTQLTSKSYNSDILFILLHGGSILDTGQDQLVSKNADVSTLFSTFSQVATAHYASAVGHIYIRLVPCPAICSEALTTLISLYPEGFDAVSPTVDNAVSMKENFPMSSLALFATSSPHYKSTLAQVVLRANSTYNDFLKSEEGRCFSGQVCLLADSVGSILGYDILCRSDSYDAPHTRAIEDVSHLLKPESPLEASKQVSLSNPSLRVPDVQRIRTVSASEKEDKVICYERHSSCPSSRRTSSTREPGEFVGFDFDVSEFFAFGSPLGLVLAYRKMCASDFHNYQLAKPQCHQMYNLFYSSDPTAVRLEPLFDDKFKFIPPVKLPRYNKFPFGDGIAIHTVETLQSYQSLFTNGSSRMNHGSQSSYDETAQNRRQSRLSMSSQSSDQVDITVASFTSVTARWWGNKRLDYSIYCPDALQNFPATALPYLLHASFWESTDLVAFIFRQVVRQEYAILDPTNSDKNYCMFPRDQPREKWLKRRTTIKVKNVAPNHRANDVIGLEGKPQTLMARFMYGPLDVVSLSGEKVDVHILTQPPTGSWVYFGTEVTDANGRATYHIPEEKSLPEGIYPVKMIVRGDHTSVDFFMAVLPPKTETAVFSIDGSFTASVSIMGRDPKVRAGAVDVVRHWQELGYLIIYITARPDMQQRRVVTWLAQHNFPHGMVAFMDGLSTDPLRQKANFLKQLVQEAQINVSVAYGSSKDIAVYQAVGLQPNQIFIVGKVAKRNRKDVVVIAEGYAAHLNELATQNLFKPAILNARLSFRKGCFSLINANGSGKNPVRKTTSLPQRASFREQALPGPGPTISVSEAGNTILEQAGK